MSEIIPHYRVKCVSDFTLASEGSIDLRKYAEEFKDQARIDELREEFCSLAALGVSPENAERIAQLSIKIAHEAARAVFPFRYVRYGTSIFGSARLCAEDPEFKEVTEIAKGIVSESRVDIITGGGPGVMEAANLGLKKGATARRRKGKANRAKNNGLLIKLPCEESANCHLDMTAAHSTFGTRLNEFADRSNSTISWDGGGGTDLENAFIYQLKQVGHVEADFPIIFKRSIWEMVQEAKMKAMYYSRVSENRKPLISPNDLNLIQFADHPDDAVQAVLIHYEDWKKRVWSKLDGESQEFLMAA